MDLTVCDNKYRDIKKYSIASRESLLLQQKPKKDQQMEKLLTTVTKANPDNHD